jgi:hypothetical protein
VEKFPKSYRFSVGQNSGALAAANLNGYEFAAQGLDEIGRMAGGWWKSARTAPEGKDRSMKRAGNLWPPTDELGEPAGLGAGGCARQAEAS